MSPKEELEQQMSDPEIIRLYAELADEDVELANQGMDEYNRLLQEADDL